MSTICPNDPNKEIVKKRNSKCCLLLKHTCQMHVHAQTRYTVFLRGACVHVHTQHTVHPQQSVSSTD